MRTERILSIVLAMVLLASAVSVAITPATAIGQYEKKILGDADGNNELTKEELVNAILPYMLDEGDFTLDDVGDASWVYAYWDGEPRTVRDSYRGVTMYRPAERVVTTFYPMMIVAIKAEDRVVGIGHSHDAINDMLFPAFVDIPYIGMTSNLNYEVVLSLQPDLVFIVPGGQGRGADASYNKLKSLNPDIPLPQFESAGRSQDRPYYVEMVRQFGRILDKEDEGEEFIDYYEGFLDVLAEKVSDIPEEDKPRVYAMCLHGYYGDFRTYYSDLVEAAGGNDIFNDVPSGIVSTEEVIKRDPEVIIIQELRAGGYGIDDVTKLEEARDNIMNLPVLANVTAVKTGRVYVVPTDLNCCKAKGGRFFLGIAYFAKIIYPDMDIDPMALHQEFLTEFQGLDYDLSKHGTFVYHPVEYPKGR